MGKEGGIEQGGRREGMDGEVYVLVTVCLNVDMSTCVHVHTCGFFNIFLIPVQYSNFVHYFKWTCFNY